MQRLKLLFSPGVIYFLKIVPGALSEEDSLIDALSDVIYVAGIDAGEVNPTILGDVDMFLPDHVFHLLDW